MKLRFLQFVVPTVALSVGLFTWGCSEEGSDDGSGGQGGGGGAASSGGSSSGSGGGVGTGGRDGSGGEGGEHSNLPPQKAVDELTNESADNYEHNRWGLIAGATLETYATTWGTQDTAAAGAAPNGRPAHLADDARLIVLQLNEANRGGASSTEDYVPSNPSEGVYVYQLDSFRFNETRDTGLISNSVRYQASGETTDDWLSRYGIDLSRDFVVFAAGSNTAANGGFFQDLARAIYWLQYWGADLDHLAIYNGTLEKNYEGTLSNAALPEGSVSNDGFSVKDLRTDNTGLTIPLEDFLKIVDEGESAEGVVAGFDKQFIIDARPTGQFNRTTDTASFHDTHPGQFITTAWNSSGAPSNNADGRAKSYVLYEGHVKGAASFPWANLIKDAGDSNYVYKSKSEIADVFAAAGYEASDAESTVIVSQCRTNFEVQVNGFAARVILGYPTVHFDGSLVEYFSLVSEHPTASFNLAPTDPAYRFRTDTPERSQFYAEAVDTSNPPTTTEDDDGVAAYNVPSGTEAADRKVGQAVINKNATTTRLALDADRNYKALDAE